MTIAVGISVPDNLPLLKAGRLLGSATVTKFARKRYSHDQIWSEAKCPVICP